MPAVQWKRTPPAPEDREWDANAAIKRLREFFDDDPVRGAVAFAWRAPEVTSWGDLKFPHHDVIDGRLHVVWRAVANAMARLNQADIPREDRRGVYNHLRREYEIFDKEPPEMRFTEEVVSEFKFEAVSGRTSRVQLMRPGTFRHPFYGELRFNEAFFSKLVHNFEQNVLGTDIAIDLSHKPQLGAAGWIRKLMIQEDGLWAEVEWTAMGEDMVKGRVYRYMSVEYAPDYEDAETGERYGPTLLGAALTNRPFIKGMAPVYMSEQVIREEMQDLVKYYNEVVCNNTGGSEMSAERVVLDEEMVSRFKELLKLDAFNPEVVLSRIDQLVNEFQKTTERVQALEERLRHEQALRLLEEAKQAGKLFAWELEEGSVMYELAHSNPDRFRAEIDRRPVVLSEEEIGTSAGAEEPEVDVEKILESVDAEGLKRLLPRT